MKQDALGYEEFMNVLDYFIVYACIYISRLCIYSQGCFTLGVKAVKSWGQLNQYLSSLEDGASLK